MLAKKGELGQLIRTMRLSREMTQADLAKKINQSQSSITMYETGRREPDFETMEALADAFNVPLQTLISKDPVPPVVMRESVKRLFDEISAAGLSDEEADYIRSLVSGVKALRKP